MLDTEASMNTIGAWSARFTELAEFEGPRLLDSEIAQRIANARSLWDAPLDTAWHRGTEDDEKWKAERYRRSDINSPRRGEHWLESQILRTRFDAIQCLGGRLVDGVNAFPLGRPDKVVEADLVLLVEVQHHLQIVVVEAKWSDRDPWGSNHPWYAVLENLRQLRLFMANPHAPRFFHRRRALTIEQIPVMGMVLAPSAYYAREGQRRNSLAPARQLIEAMKPYVEVVLAVYDHDESSAEIRPLVA